MLKDMKVLTLPKVDFKKSTRPNVCVQLRTLLWRNRTALKRDPLHSRVRIGQTAFMAILVLILFHDLYGNSRVVQMGLAGAMFFVSIATTMSTLMTTLLTFQNERPIFLREYANQMYSVPPYYLGKIIIETPLLNTLPMLFTVIIYFKIGVTITAPQFFYFYLIVLLIGHSAASFGYFFSSLFNNEETAVMISPIFMMPIILFSGFFSNIGSYPAWMMWLQYLSPIRYGLECFVRNEFGNRTYLPGEVNLLTYLAYNIGLWQCLVIMAALAIGLRLISMIMLRLLVERVQ